MLPTEKTVPRRYQMVLEWNLKEYKYFQWQVKHQLIIIMKRDGFLRSRANSYLLVRNGKRNRWAVPKRSIWPPEYCFPFCTSCITLYTGVFTWTALKFWHETFAYISFLSLFTCITATSEITRSSTGQTKLIQSKKLSTRSGLRPLFYSFILYSWPKGVNFKFQLSFLPFIQCPRLDIVHSTLIKGIIPFVFFDWEDGTPFLKLQKDFTKWISSH